MDERDIVGLLEARRGHFLLESGHHGDLWLEVAGREGLALGALATLHPGFLESRPG